MTPRDRTASGRFRILVIADQTLEDDALHDLVVTHTGGMASEVLIVAPNADATSDADARVQQAVAGLDAAGIHAYGWAGHPDPMTAIAGALAVFEADEIVIATRFADAAGDLARRASGRFGLPTSQLVVDRALMAA